MDFITYLYDFCKQREIICCAGENYYDSLTLDKQNIRVGQLILLVDVRETQTPDEVRITGKLALCRKSEENTHSSLDETYEDKLQRRLLELEGMLKGILETAECNMDGELVSATYRHILNQYDLNIDGVEVTLSMTFSEGIQAQSLPKSDLEERVEKLEGCCDELHSVISVSQDPNTLTVDGRILKKRGEQPIYDEIKAVDISSSYTSGQQIATVSIDGKSKPIYVRESIFLDGVFSPNRQLWFKMDEETETLQVSFDKGRTWKTVTLTEY